MLLKHALLISLAALVGASTGFAQERIYRCGNEYTNKPNDQQMRTCKVVDGNGVSVVQSFRPPPSGGASGARPASAGPRVDANDQRARDADARAVLESELKKAEAKQAELLAEYKDGQPDLRGGESRNHQKYLDRVAELKASIARNESDIAGIKRELARLTGTPSAAASATK